MLYDYNIQLPNMDVGVYTPRSIRPDMLLKINEIAIDWSKYTEFTFNSGNFVINAVYLSAVITTTINANDVTSYAKSCKLHNLEPTLYDAVHVLNEKTQDWHFALKRVGTWDNVQLALMEGYPVMAGGTVYSSFLKAETNGIVPMPKVGEDLLGGQLVSVVSINRDKDLVLAIGNQGQGVGNKGLFQYRGSHLRNLMAFRDFFVLIPRSIDAGN